ncbi:MAG TPA: hypothetical protein VLH12_08570 [Usitatibacter sp.]|nr:hypothetical protein [Usitatibacter sp.]
MNKQHPSDEVRPNPDPTILTQERIREEDDTVREVLGTRIDGLHQLIESLLREARTRQEKNDAAFKHAEDIRDHKFAAVDGQFKAVQQQLVERDLRYDHSLRDLKGMFDAAIKAERDAMDRQNTANSMAVSKSEAAITKQIDLLTAASASQNKNLSEKIADLNGRILTIEGRNMGRRETREFGASGVTVVTAIVTTLISLAAVFISLRPNSAPPAQAPAPVYAPPPPVYVLPQQQQPQPPARSQP